MTNKRYDLAILGGGPGGYVAAIRAAQLNLRTALIEKDPVLGGTCLNRGCIPTKALLYYSELFTKIGKADKYGVILESPPKVDMKTVQKKKKRVINRLTKGLSSLIKKNQIDLFQARGRLGSDHTIELDDGTALEAEHIILATGSQPTALPGITPDGKLILTSDHMLESEVIPKTLIVIGAGAVGLEFASIYSRYGSKVNVIELLPRPLPLEDEEISEELRKAMKRQGVTIHTSTKVEEVRLSDNKVYVTAAAENAKTEMEAELLLLAVGRRPVTEGLGYSDHGLAFDGPYIKVNQYMQTSTPNIYAIGDLVRTPQLAHVASAEGILAVEHLAGLHPSPIDYNRIPSATYCNPEVASVGLTEKQAREQGYAVKVGKFPWSALGKAVILEETEGFVKIVADEKYGELLGVHIIGPHATDLIAEACVALTCEATVEELFRTIHAHPTLPEAVAEAAHGVFGYPLHLPPTSRRTPVHAG